MQHTAHMHTRACMNGVPECMVDAERLTTQLQGKINLLSEQGVHALCNVRGWHFVVWMFLAQQHHILATLLWHQLHPHTTSDLTIVTLHGT